MRTLKDRLWARGLNPYLVKRSGANMVRSIVNMRGHESLAIYRDNIRKGGNAKSVLRIARAAVKRQRECLQHWKDKGGYLP